MTSPAAPPVKSLQPRLARVATLMSLVAALSACGGGGGDDDEPAASPPPPAVPAPPPPGTPAPPPPATPAPPPPATPAPPPPATPAPPPPSAFTIRGRATFESVPHKIDGSLDHAASIDRPVRGATVQLLDAAGAVLASTVSDAAGDYSLGLAAAQSVKVRVRAEIRRTGSAAGDRDVRVVDNTAAGALYVLDSTAFTPSAATVTQNLRAASGWGGAAYTQTRAAAPFAILDTIYQAQAKVESVAAVALPALQVNWSVNNRPVDGNPATGAIGTSYFTPGPTPALYLLGAENTDTDEYDGHVIAHEFGHYLQYALSRDDSIGGAHYADDRLDMRVAFSEGWGYAWAAIVLGDPLAADSYGPMQSQGFTIAVNAPAVGTDRGSYSETTAQYLIYTASATFGFAPVYAALNGLRSLPAFSSLYSFADRLKATSGNAAAVTALWATQNVAAGDAYGGGETNDGGIASSLPIVKTHTAPLGAAQNYCITNAADPYRETNKLGETVFVRFTFSGTRTLTVTRTTSAGPTNPKFTVLKSDASKVSADAPVLESETLTTNLPAGTHLLALTDVNLFSSLGGPSCYDFKVD